MPMVKNTDRYVPAGRRGRACSFLRKKAKQRGVILSWLEQNQTMSTEWSNQMVVVTLNIQFGDIRLIEKKTLEKMEENKKQCWDHSGSINV